MRRFFLPLKGQLFPRARYYPPKRSVLVAFLMRRECLSPWLKIFRTIL